VPTEAPRDIEILDVRELADGHGSEIAIIRRCDQREYAISIVDLDQLPASLIPIPRYLAPTAEQHAAMRPIA
jgi:hypothetical protein